MLFHVSSQYRGAINTLVRDSVNFVLLAAPWAITAVDPEARSLHRPVMDEALLETLPLSHRLALSYAPRKARAATLGLLALEQRLAGIVSGDAEPMIAQIKLAWWRERLSDDPTTWPKGEPLLALLAQFGGDLARLVPLVDGHEVLLSEQFDRTALTTYRRGKSLAWAALADAVGNGRSLSPVESAAKELCLFELSHRLSDENEIAMVRDDVEAQDWKPAKLSRDMRTLAVLHALARRAMSRETHDLLDGSSAMFTAMRVGITGR